MSSTAPSSLLSDEDRVGDGDMQRHADACGAKPLAARLQRRGEQGCARRRPLRRWAAFGRPAQVDALAALERQVGEDFEAGRRAARDRDDRLQRNVELAGRDRLAVGGLDRACDRAASVGDPVTAADGARRGAPHGGCGTTLSACCRLRAGAASSRWRSARKASRSRGRPSCVMSLRVAVSLSVLRRDVPQRDVDRAGKEKDVVPEPAKRAAAP